MNETKSNLIPAIIIAAGLIIASLIYAYAHRYEVESYIRYDKWTGTMEKMELIK